VPAAEEFIAVGLWFPVFVAVVSGIPGAVNIEWRQAVARRGELPKERMVVVYCNSGSLSAQGGFALRLLGYDNVKVLQDGYEGWKAKGGFDAHRRASRSAGH